MNDIYICHTVYHIYISMLKVFDNKGTDTLVIVDTVPKGRQLADKIREVHIFCDVIFIDRKVVFGKAYREYIKNYFLCKVCRKKINCQLSFIKQCSEVYIFNDYTEMGCYLENESIHYHLLEDGLDVYKQFDVYESVGRGYTLKKALYKFAKIPYSVGMNRCCLDVEINDAEGLKTRIKQPIVVKNRKVLEDSVTTEYQKLMNKAFGVEGNGTIESGILILTQILPEILVVSTKEEQYKFYEKVIKKYCKDFKVYLKPHPRDDIDYSDFVEKYHIEVLKKEIPMEVYASLPHIHFDSVITYSSTAANIDGLADRIIRMDESIEL